MCLSPTVTLLNFLLLSIFTFIELFPPFQTHADFSTISFVQSSNSNITFTFVGMFPFFATFVEIFPLRISTFSIAKSG